MFGTGRRRSRDHFLNEGGWIAASVIERIEGSGQASQEAAGGPIQHCCVRGDTHCNDMARLTSISPTGFLNACRQCGKSAVCKWSVFAIDPEKLAGGILQSCV